MTGPAVTRSVRARMTRKPETYTGEPWSSALLPADATLQDAISNLDRSGLQIALIVAPDRTLVGTLTDGDIRRGLLRGLQLGSQVASIIHREPLVVPPQLGRDNALQLMQANRIHLLPIIDEHRR